jgi:hypothetical protein
MHYYPLKSQKENQSNCSKMLEGTQNEEEESWHTFLSSLAPLDDGDPEATMAVGYKPPLFDPEPFSFP